MSTSTTVKRARVTARIAEAESAGLPTSSETTQQLVEQTEQKRKQLDKKCSEYEQICKRVAKLKAERNRIESEKTQLMAHADEVDQMFVKLERGAEESFLTQQQKNNEMNEAMQQWNALEGKEEKLYNDLAHETDLERDFRERCREIKEKLEQLGTEAETDENEFRQLEAAFDTDMKTEKTLEQYLTRLVDDVFMNQRRLEDIHIGTSRGRANFRQAEKVLRDQRRRHRRLSSQAFETTNTDRGSVFETEQAAEEHRQLNEMEDAWDLLQEKVRLKESEVAEEAAKMNARLKQLENEQNFALDEVKKQTQAKIAEDYANLNSFTPMYAAYSSALKMGSNFVDTLQTAGRTSGAVKKESTVRSSRSSSSSRSTVEFSNELNEFHEYSEMIDSRKRILRATENEAYRVLTNELRVLEGVVSGQRQEAHALDREVRWLNENIQLRQADILFYTNKTEELIERARKEDEHKLHDSLEHKSHIERISMDLDDTRSNVLELRDRRLILENERNMLANQIKDRRLECDRLNDQWKILKSFTNSLDTDSIHQMSKSKEQWKLKVEQLENQIAKFQRMEDYASLANGQLRNNLALLKPYDEEYQEFENLLEANKQLNDQLVRHEFRKQVDKHKYEGDIGVLS